MEDKPKFLTLLSASLRFNVLLWIVVLSSANAIPQPLNDITDGSGRALDNRFWVAQYDANQKIMLKKSTGGLKLREKPQHSDEPAFEQKQLFRPRSKRSRRFTRTKATTSAVVETQASVLAEINALLSSMQVQVTNCL